jgi:2-dehydropantoate 2-reductase
MKIVVMGAGGVGGYFGGRLAKAGLDVAFVARGAHLKAMQTAGLRVESPIAGDFTLPQVKASDDPAKLGHADLVLFATKAYDLESAAQKLLPILDAKSVVLPLLNGVDIADRLAAVLGAGRVLGGMCQVSSAIKAPGVVRHAALNRIVFGELAGGTSPRLQAIQEALASAGIVADVSPSIVVDIWKKYLFISAAAGVCSLTRSTMGPVLKDPDTRALLVGCMQEAEALARRKGVPLPATIVQDTVAFMDGQPPGVKPSLLLSLEQGAPLELDAISGTAVRLGRELGVPTPINHFITAALKLHVAGQHRS